MKNVRATVAEFERLKIVERNTRGRRQKVEAGSVMTHGQAPYGYRLGKRGNKWILKIHKPEAKIVRLIFEWYIHGDGDNPPLGIIGIVRKLSDLQIPTYQDVRDAESAATGTPKKHGRKKRSFGEWSRAGVWHILRNKTYTGTWHYGKRGINPDGSRYEHEENNQIPVKVPVIIEPEVWNEAQKRLVYNRENSLTGQKHKYLLGKRVYCGDCGSKMQATPNYTGKRIYFYYACKASRAYAKDCKNTVTYSARMLDSLTWEWVKSLLSDPLQLQEGLDQYKTQRDTELAPFQQRLDVLEELITNNRAQLDRLLDLFLAGDFPKEVLIDRKARLEETIIGLERERSTVIARLNTDLTAEIEIAIKEVVAKIGQGLNFADNNFDAQRQIIELLDVKAILGREHGQKVAHVSCMLGSEILELTAKNGGGTDGGQNLRLASNSFGMDGENRFPRL
jgi:site-specific DNA recombinase